MGQHTHAEPGVTLTSYFKAAVRARIQALTDHILLHTHTHTECERPADISGVGVGEVELRGVLYAPEWRVCMCFVCEYGYKMFVLNRARARSWWTNTFSVWMCTIEYEFASPSAAHITLHTYTSIRTLATASPLHSNSLLHCVYAICMLLWVCVGACLCL